MNNYISDMNDMMNNIFSFNQGNKNNSPEIQDEEIEKDNNYNENYNEINNVKPISNKLNEAK